MACPPSMSPEAPYFTEALTNGCRLQLRPGARFFGGSGYAVLLAYRPGRYPGGAWTLL